MTVCMILHLPCFDWGSVGYNQCPMNLETPSLAVQLICADSIDGYFHSVFVLFTQEHMFQTTFSTSWFAISDCAKSQCTEVTHNVRKYVHNAAQLAQSSLQQGAYNLLLLILPIPYPNSIVLLVCEWESYKEWFQPDSESENWTPTYFICTCNTRQATWWL